MTALILALLTWCAVAAAAQGATPPAAPARCTQVDMRADVAECDTSACRLRDNAQITCDAIVLMADAIDVAFDANRVFAGATAWGHATLVDGNMVGTCERITLGAD